MEWRGMVFPARCLCGRMLRAVLAGVGGRVGAVASFPSPQWDLGACTVSSEMLRGGQRGGRAG